MTSTEKYNYAQSNCYIFSFDRRVETSLTPENLLYNHPIQQNIHKYSS